MVRLVATPTNGQKAGYSSLFQQFDKIFYPGLKMFVLRFQVSRRKDLKKRTVSIHRTLFSRKNAFTSGSIKPPMCLPLPEINCHGYLYQVSEFVFCSVMCCLQTQRSLDLDVVFFSELLRNLRKALIPQ